MADYNYDEGGILAAYFLITFLALILVPLTLSLYSSKPKHTPSGCQCRPCIEQRSRNSQRNKGSLLNPKLGKKHIFLAVGWAIMAALCYRVAGAKLESVVYDPFEILGISSSSTEKEIKKHYRKLALKFHPDKVRLTANQTMESVSSYFTELTKAYKALTDEEVRENLRKWGHPDGRQPTSTGIALPKWVIEGHNNKWVLGMYGILFGGALPAIVGRWWFGSRQKTKDGIHAQAAATLFKGLKEDSTIADVVHLLAQAFEWELPAAKIPADGELNELESAIAAKLGERWKPTGKLSQKTRLATILLYAHMLRLDVKSPALQKLQTEILLQAPTLVNALFNMASSRNWLTATLSVVRAFPYLIQAVEPGSIDSRWTQLPGVSESESQALYAANDLEDVVAHLDKNVDAKKAINSWGRVELVDAAYKVIGERIVVPASIVYLVVKLRLSPPNSAKPEEPDVDETKRRIKVNDAKDAAFLEGRDELEPLTDDLKTIGYAHAPHWPSDRKPTWWLILADEKSNRIVVPPTKITEIPYANASQPDGRDYRCYKFQFQAPQGTGLFTWKIYIVSDTYIGQELKHDMALRIEDASALDVEDAAEDEISDPDEDTLAGQMALMKGGKVKKAVQEEESDDESDTDGDESSGSSSDSD